MNSVFSNKLFGIRGKIIQCSLQVCFVLLLFSWSESVAQTERVFSRDGMSLKVPTGWKMTADNSLGSITIYNLENRNMGLLMFYKVPQSLAPSIQDFAKSTSKDMGQSIQENCTCVVLNGELKAQSKRLSNKTVYGYKEKMYVKNLLLSRDSYYVNVEYFQVTAGSNKVILVTVGESGSSDINDLDKVLSSFRVN